MSSSGSSIQSRPSLTNSTIESPPAISEEPPSVDARVREFYDTYPDKADQPLLGTSAEDPREAYAEGVGLRPEVVRRTDGGDTFSVTWGAAVRWYLEYCEERREPARGRFLDPVDGKPFEVEFLPHSYHPDYLTRDYAQLMGLSRELERLEGDAHVALVTLTASGRSYAGPVDHQLDRRDAWKPTLRALRHVMDSAGERGDVGRWGYELVEEQHPGTGMAINGGLGHDHVMVFWEGQPLDRDDFRPVVSRWLDACEGAAREAHRVDHPDPEKRCVDVRRVDPDADADQDGGPIRSVGQYLTKYLWPDGGEQLPVERPIERVMYEAVKWSTGTRRRRQSDTASRAIKADLCRQKAGVGDRTDHGERLVHDDGRGPEIVCAECGSGWGVDPEAGTIVEARRPEPEPAELEAIITPDGEEYTPSGGGVTKEPVLGWDHAPLGVASTWRADDRMGRRPEGLYDGPPPPDAQGRVWSRPPPGDLFSERGRRTVVREAVAILEGEERGAMVTEVVDRAVTEDVDRELAEETVRDLLERGVLFSMESGRVRVT